MTGHNPADLEAEAEALSFDCILCGICCSIYQVRITREEAATLADHISMEFYDWVGRFCDPRWHDSCSYLVCHEGGHCVFLKRGDDRRTALCSVYDVRPSSCRDWKAGTDKPECQEGLRRYWKVQVDDGRHLVGTPLALSRLRTFLDLLV
ncbi:YkgJ family cysteine cluster protein [Chloroflexota bacterium]